MAEKTEAPTPRKRDEARQKGQGVGRSAEFSMGLTLGVGTLALSSLLPGMATQLIAKTQATILTMEPHATNAHLLAELGSAIQTLLMLVLPLALIVMVAGVAGNIASGGLVFSYKSIRFDISRINPLSGMKRLLDKQALVRLGLSSAKLAILALISWQVVGSRVPKIVGTQGSSAATIAGSCLDAIFQLGLTITILLAVVALTDFVIQRRKASNSIKMTKEEVKQEYRESEGDPLVRGARKRRARQMAFARMMDAVPTADVVITNPTTLAVALKYDSLTMKAPKIVAKGQRLMAERIKKLAREYRVPIIEDKPLARSLFSRPVGAEVPAHLYRAVARLLVLVHQARFGVGARQAAGRRPARGWAAQQTAAAAGMSTRPWWADGAGAGVGVDTTTSGPSVTRVDGALIDDAASTGEPPLVVDEEALARAMADDELADLTADELSEFEAARDPDAIDAESIDPDAIDAESIDEETER